MKEGWKQKRVLERICNLYIITNGRKCKRKVFYCTGACGNLVKLHNTGACSCPDCVDEAILRFRADVCPNYKGLSPDEVFKECYGYERGMDTEKET